MPKTEVEKFLEGVKQDAEEPIETLDPKVPAKDDLNGDPDPEKVPESIKDRQHRRLQARLQTEREANIILNERLKAKEETIQNVSREIPIDSRLKRLFGEDEKGIEISKHFTEILNEYKGSARTEAIKQLREELAEEKTKEAAAISSYESKIESGLESIEDEYGVDMTSDSASKSRKEFLDFITKIAPKDKDGSPIELPDLVGAYEVFKSTKAPATSSRRTEIASRSMQPSGKVDVQKEQMDDTERWLQQNGIQTRNRQR